MSTRLNNVAEDLSRRLAVRRRMLDHLGLTFTESATARCYEDLRETVLSCAHCTDPSICEAWLEQGHSGPPEFCTGRSAFLALRATLEASPVEIGDRAVTGTYG